MPRVKSNTYALRREAKVSQGYLARKADLDPGTVSAAENGKNISDNTRLKLAGAFSELLGREVLEIEIVKRMTLEEKRQVAEILGAPNRPLNRIVELTKPNGAPDYNSESLRARSQSTAKARGVRFSRVAKKMAEKA